MKVEVQGEQGTYVHSENKVCFKVARYKHGIQAVDTFNDDNGVFLKLHLMTCPDSLSKLEAEGGNFYLLTLEKLLEVLSKKLGIDGIDMLKVELSVGTGSYFISIDIVIVKAHKNGCLSVNAKLSCKSVGACCFA